MDESTLFSLLVDLHRDGERQGPGSDHTTVRALDLTGLDRTAPLKVADIGCGTGASTLVLAKQLVRAHVVAVDLFPEFLDVLAERARAAGCSDRIEVRAESMDALTLASGSLDLIWSEGAIYNLGFGAGIEAWRPFLRTGGVLAVSEITWLRPDPPEEIRAHWGAEYPEIAPATEKTALLERAGYDLLGCFMLPSTDWIDTYYAPIESRIPAFLERHAGQPEALEVVAMQRAEHDLYLRYRDWYSYGFYLARKR